MNESKTRSIQKALELRGITAAFRQISTAGSQAPVYACDLTYNSRVIVTGQAGTEGDALSIAADLSLGLDARTLRAVIDSGNRLTGSVGSPGTATIVRGNGTTVASGTGDNFIAAALDAAESAYPVEAAR